MLFQRRDDDVPIFMLKTTDEIKQLLEEKIEVVRRSASPNPQPTNILIKWSNKGQHINIYIYIFITKEQRTQFTSSQLLKIQNIAKIQ